MLKAVFDFNHVIGIAAGLSVIFGAVYMLRFFQKTMFGPSNEQTSSITDIAAQQLTIVVIYSRQLIEMKVSLSLFFMCNKVR